MHLREALRRDRRDRLEPCRAGYGRAAFVRLARVGHERIVHLHREIDVRIVRGVHRVPLLAGLRREIEHLAVRWILLHERGDTRLERRDRAPRAVRSQADPDLRRAIARRVRVHLVEHFVRIEQRGIGRALRHLDRVLRAEAALDKCEPPGLAEFPAEDVRGPRAVRRASCSRALACSCQLEIAECCSSGRQRFVRALRDVDPPPGVSGRVRRDVLPVRLAQLQPLGPARARSRELCVERRHTLRRVAARGERDLLERVVAGSDVVGVAVEQELLATVDHPWRGSSATSAHQGNL